MRDGRLEQALRPLTFPVPPTETRNELIDVLLQMLPGGAVESTQHEALEMGDDQMDLRQPLFGLLGRRRLGVRAPQPVRTLLYQLMIA